MSRVPRTEDAVNQETHVGEETAPQHPEPSQEKLRGGTQADHWLEDAADQMSPRRV